MDFCFFDLGGLQWRLGDWLKCRWKIRIRRPRIITLLLEGPIASCRLAGNRLIPNDGHRHMAALTKKASATTLVSQR